MNNIEYKHLKHDSDFWDHITIVMPSVRYCTCKDREINKHWLYRNLYGCTRKNSVKTASCEDV